MAKIIYVYKGDLTASITKDGMSTPCNLEDLDVKLQCRGYVRKWRKKYRSNINEKWVKESK